MKIIFFGSDDFATRHLEELLKIEHEVLACVTPVDRPKGRGMTMHESPVKMLALKHNIEVLQPVSLKSKEIADQLIKLGAQLFIVIAYGCFLPQNILDIPLKGAINVHGSLLPKYRGAAPINLAILKGDKVTGISIIQMNAKMDAGDVLSRVEVDILLDDTAITLRKKMMDVGAQLLVKTVNDIEVGIVQSTVQNESEVTFAPKLTKDLGKIDWSSSAEVIYNQVRGLKPWPSAYTSYETKQLKVIKCKILEVSHQENISGEVIDINNDGVVVATGQGAIILQSVHLANAKEMNIHDFLRGYSIQKGYKFI